MGEEQNSPHRRKTEGQKAQEEKRESSRSEYDMQTGPVPRICMDYFYLSNRCLGDRKGGQTLSTKELQMQFKEMGKSGRGSRQELVKRYDKDMPQDKADGERDGEQERGIPPHAAACVGEPTDGNCRRVHR